MLMGRLRVVLVLLVWEKRGGACFGLTGGFVKVVFGFIFLCVLLLRQRHVIKALIFSQSFGWYFL